jgi:hypothetical protein
MHGVHRPWCLLCMWLSVHQWNPVSTHAHRHTNQHNTHHSSAVAHTNMLPRWYACNAGKLTGCNLFTFQLPHLCSAGHTTRLVVSSRSMWETSQPGVRNGCICATVSYHCVMHAVDTCSGAHLSVMCRVVILSAVTAVAVTASTTRQTLKTRRGAWP